MRIIINEYRCEISVGKRLNKLINTPFFSGPTLKDNESLPRNLPAPGSDCRRQPASLRSRGRRHLREERNPLRGPPRQGREGRVDPGLGRDDRVFARKRLVPVLSLSNRCLMASAGRKLIRHWRGNVLRLI